MNTNFKGSLAVVASGLISLSFLLGSTANLSAGDRYLEAGIRTLPHSTGEVKYNNVVILAQWYEDEVRFSTRTETYTDLICEELPGKGSSEYWDQYYSAPQDQKAEALDAAIAGIGPTRSKKIVAANREMGSRGYFYKKARNWELFKNEIDRIETELDLKNIYRDVIMNKDNRIKNLTNLGYATTEHCQEVTKTRLVVDETIKKVPREAVPISVDVTITGDLLLNGEREELTLRYDGGNQVVLDSVNGYNSYKSFYDGRGTLSIQGTGRLAVRPSTSDFTFSLAKGNGSLVLNVSDKKYDELKEQSPDYKLNVSFKLYRQIKGCGKKDAVVVTTTETLDRVNDQIDLTKLIQSKGGEQIQAGGVYYLYDLTFERVGTPFFSNTSDKTETPKITY